MLSVEERMRAALDSGTEELWRIIKDPHPQVISNAILNRNLTEEMAVFIAKGKAVSSESLGFLAGDIRFKESYKLKVAICKNPKTPQRVSLSLLKFIRLFDLAEIIKDQHLNINLRQKVQYIISERMPSMPLGVKTALAKRANSVVLLSLMENGDEEVVRACLESPALTEEVVCRLLNRPDTKATPIRLIAEHPKWSLRYSVRYALIRSFYTPMRLVTKFIQGTKTADLKDLYSDPKVPSATRPFLFRELGDRGETTEVLQDEVYDLAGDEDAEMPDTGGLKDEKE